MAFRLEESGTLPKPLLIGRLTRVGLGLFLLYFVVWRIARDYRYGFVVAVDDSLFWLGIFVSLWAIIEVANVALGRQLKQWPRYLACAALLGGMLLDSAQSGQAWGANLTLVGFVLMFLVGGFAGLSFLLSATLAVPG